MNTKLIAKNPVAYHNFNIESTYEAGIVLTGTEIKSIRAGKINLKDSYAGFKDGECFVYSMHISPYEHGNIFNKDPLRDRKLLLTKKELNKIFIKVKQDGYSLVPISLYFKGSLVKLELGVGKGKKLYDKRQDIAKKDAERRMQKALRAKEKRNLINIYSIQKKELNSFFICIHSFHILIHQVLKYYIFLLVLHL